jgi:hypothetical protein
MDISDEERNSRDKAIRSSLASVRIEGLEPSPGTIRDLEAWREGKLSFDELMRRIDERVRERPGTK